MNKSQLAIILSKLKSFEKPKAELEQYQTESEIAAEALWDINHKTKLKNKVIIDLGCGTGIFGFGASLLGAKKVFLIDLDKDAIELTKHNKEILEKDYKLNTEIIHDDIRNINILGDIVIQNPPFGVQKSHTDKLFLIKAMELSNLIYTFHKLETKNFIEKFTKENNFKSTLLKEIKFPLKKTMFFHKKKTYYADVGLFEIKKN